VHFHFLLFDSTTDHVIKCCDGESFIPYEYGGTKIYQQPERWLTKIYLPKKVPYLNPNERKLNKRITSYVCANRFYQDIEDQKVAISEYLNKRFGRWE
jgi:hypothetical protein